MQRVSQRRQRRFVEGLAHRGVSVDRQGHVFEPRAHFQRERKGGRKFRHARADGVDADAIIRRLVEAVPQEA